MTREQVLNVAHLVLTQCDYAQTRDKKGYDKFDATTIRRILSLNNPDDAEIEYLRQKLLRYLNQVKKIGREFKISNKKIEEVCKELKEPAAPYSAICYFQTNDNKWHFGLREANSILIPPSDKSEGILE